ncbi:MAG: hypothetical protein E5W81_29295, partial [Mesorhizobium sp.]
RLAVSLTDARSNLPLEGEMSGRTEGGVTERCFGLPSAPPLKSSPSPISASAAGRRGRGRRNLRS